MKYFIYCISIVAIIGINLGLFNNLQIGGQIPNLLFLMSMCFALDKKDNDFFFVSFLSGIFLDFYSTNFFGGFTLGFLIVSLMLRIFADNVLMVEFNWKTLSSVLAVSLFIFNLIIWFYGFLVFKLNWDNQYDSYKVFLASFLPSLFYTWLFLYPMYALSAFIRQFIDNWNIRSRGVIS